ncbi:MAG: DUF4143 domain-containing protein [Erysipelotrichaceae bacterium]|jgi:hypothetical protein|nr:DUF4143 domain-containing protein [Erysipelotrichaceae bacterium]
MEQELTAFHAALMKYGKEPYEKKNNWFDTFLQLEHLIEQSGIEGKKVIFIDEMPRLDTPKSKFLPALEYLWNSYASANPDILLVVCGSATSWIVKNVLKNTQGLFNRVTRQMYLEPFTLRETELFFQDRGIIFNRYNIIESYMIFGGIPYYLDLFDSTYGLPKNIDMIFFGPNALLKNEYQNLFNTLFKNAENHHRIVTALAKKSAGMTREELLAATKIKNGGTFTDALEDLQLSGLIRKYNKYLKKSKGVVYQLMDAFVLFYYRFLKDGVINDENYWSNSYDRGAHNAWAGYAFEQVCLKHQQQIRQALGIAGVAADIFFWRSNSKENHAQIDLVIDRRDQIINLCEIKYATREYEITKAYSETLEKKVLSFLSETKTKKAIRTTLITTYGVAPTPYQHAVQSFLTMNDLFG